MKTPESKSDPACASLGQLPVGVPARLCNHPGDTLRRRLTDLGLVPGTRVEVLRRAPLGGPIEVELRGYRLVLRRGEAAAICVRAHER